MKGTFAFKQDGRFKLSLKDTHEKRFDPVEWTSPFSKTQRLKGHIDMGSQTKRDLMQFLLKPVHNDNLNTGNLENFKYAGRIDSAMRFKKEKKTLSA